MSERLQYWSTTSSGSVVQLTYPLQGRAGKERVASACAQFVVHGQRRPENKAVELVANTLLVAGESLDGPSRSAQFVIEVLGRRNELLSQRSDKLIVDVVVRRSESKEERVTRSRGRGRRSKLSCKLECLGINSVASRAKNLGQRRESHRREPWRLVRPRRRLLRVAD